ncbi:hypothetical protein X975_22018, partial [Stegodyphus mimosarum]
MRLQKQPGDRAVLHHRKNQVAKVVLHELCNLLLKVLEMFVLEVKFSFRLFLLHHHLYPIHL